MFGSEYEEDFIMRQIKNIIKSVAKIAFGADTAKELRMEQKADAFAVRLTETAAAGHINEAENLLYAEKENHTPETLAAGLQFYDYLNSLDDAFLEEHDYSREEIYEGLWSLTHSYGLDEVTSLFAK